MKIRESDIKDIDGLSQLFNNYRIFYKKETDINGAKEFLTERIKNNESKIFVAEYNEILIGFVQLYPIFSSTRMKRLWLLNDLYVDEKYRGKGVSKLLIDEAKKLSSETKACGLILETEKNNTTGNKLYVKTGFIKDTEHNYYSWEE